MNIGNSFLLAVLGSGRVLGTVLSFGTVEQPVNLGAKADSLRIPLGPVGVESNHGYDIHPVISESRPSIYGGLIWERGMELNMNLASAFGIEIVPEDVTQVPGLPVTIRIKDWPVPAYSPYNKEQVLAATLHCLLRSVHATPKSPLRVHIDAENSDEAEGLAKFAGRYVTAQPTEREERTPIPGTRLDTDERGVTHVVFTERERSAGNLTDRSPPAMVPFMIDLGEGEEFYELVPDWVGDTWSGDYRDIVGLRSALFYDRFERSRRSVLDMNVLVRENLLRSYRWLEKEGETVLSVEVVADNGTTNLGRILSIMCYSAIVTQLPTEQHPLTVRVRVSNEGFGGLEAFAESDGWTLSEIRNSKDRLLSCLFVWDRAERVLSRGSVPLGRLSSQFDRPWVIRFDEGLASDD